MGLLAYDPARVTLLRHRLIAAADELRKLRSDDPSATYAMQSVAVIRQDIEQVWLPLITRIAESQALAARWWRPLADSTLAHSLITVMADGYGWSVQADSLHDDAHVVTAAEARALGATLHTVELVSLVNDHDQLNWLALQLAIIGSDPALSRDFLANFNSWAAFTFVLGSEHARAERASLTNAFDGLMSIWTHALPASALTAGKQATLARLLPPAANPDPYVQALMLRSLPVDGLTLATVTHELLGAWLAMKRDPGARVTLDRQGGLGPNGLGPNAADLLLPLLLHDSAACAWFTQLASEDPAILFETLNDAWPAYEIVLVGTDPANTTVTAAGDAVLAILEYFRVDPFSRPGFDTDGHPGDYGEFLGSLVAPWLLQFTMANDDWSATAGTKAGLLRVALRDEEAMAQLIADSERIRAGFNQSLSAHDISAAQQVGGLLNLLLQLWVNEQVDDEIANTDGRLNLLRTVVGVAASFLPGGPLAGIATGMAVTALTNKLAEYLGQPDPHGVRRTAERTMDVALALAGADVVARLHQQWVVDGDIDAAHPAPPVVELAASEPSCPSADYHDRFNAWSSTLPGGTDGSLARHANDLLAAFIGVSGAQSNCAEIAG